MKGPVENRLNSGLSCYSVLCVPPLLRAILPSLGPAAVTSPSLHPTHTRSSTTSCLSVRCSWSWRENALTCGEIWAITHSHTLFPPILSLLLSRLRWYALISLSRSLSHTHTEDAVNGQRHAARKHTHKHTPAISRLRILKLIRST